jgi:protein-L-isoaspartate(D-aspartate) O-methyltransferase
VTFGFGDMVDFAALRQRMVDNQLRTSEVTDRGVLDAFLTLPREMFVDPVDRPFAYADRELRMASAAPSRRMLDAVRLARLIHALPRGPEVKAMVVAGGTGYSTAVLSQLCGSVLLVEEDAALVRLARELLTPSLVGTDVSIAETRLADGDPRGGKYDVVLVDGAVEVIPETILQQITDGGSLATIETAGGVSRGTLFERIGTDITKWPLFDAWATVLPGFERKREFVF